MRVVSQGGPVVAAGLLQRGERLFVKPPALAPEQPAGNCFTGQRVPEREDVRRLLDYQAPVDQRAQRVQQAVLA